MRVSKCLGLLAIGLLLGGTALAQEPNEIYVSYPDGGGVYLGMAAYPLRLSQTLPARARRRGCRPR